MFGGEVIWRGFVYATLTAFGKMLCGTCLVRLSLPRTVTRSLKRLTSVHIGSCWPLRSGRGAQEARMEDQARNVDNMQNPYMPSSPTKSALSSRTPKPRSLYPAAILGSAMVARGEIGFLISSIAESKGVFGRSSEDGSSELFVVVTWAILLCTVLGPIAVGLLVKRVKRLQEAESSDKAGREDLLGVWGVIPSS